MSKLKLISTLVSAAGFYLLANSASAAGAGIVPASYGRPWDATMRPCFSAAGSAAKVSYNGCSGSLGWWNIPVPIYIPGVMTLAVYMKSSRNNNECYAEVMAEDGSLVLYDHKIFGPVDGWVTFNALPFGFERAAHVLCTVSSTSGDYISSVKGFY